MWVRSLGQEEPLEKEMATHSSSRSQRLPWTEESGRVQSIAQQGVRYNWAQHNTQICAQTPLTVGSKVGLGRFMSSACRMVQNLKHIIPPLWTSGLLVYKITTISWESNRPVWVKGSPQCLSHSNFSAWVITGSSSRNGTRGGGETRIKSQ